MADFVHLHVHSEYSLLDGLPKLEDLVKRVKDYGMKAIALTDHGVMYGAIEFYKLCKKEGIKPIVGMEGYTVPHDHKKKEGKEFKDNNHLILLAKNKAGYKNLMEISSIGHLEGFYYRPRVSKDFLKEHSEGLICLSACPKGELGDWLIAGNYEKAKEIALWFRDIFKDDYYLEIQRHQYKSFLDQVKDPRIVERLKTQQKDEDLWLNGVVKISRELGIPLVATNDVHYLKQSDAFAQDVLVCISTGKTVNELDRLRYVDVPTLFLRTTEEMEELFPDFPDALENSVKIAEKVDLQIELGKWYFPNFEIPVGKSQPDFLRETAEERFPKRYPDANDEAKKRFQYELEVIIKKGYAPYFLMMADLVNWCTGKGIVTNTRGSAAGSLVSYVLGITTVEPLKYALPFERFLNPFRPKPPDIDLDIADNRREELITYITEKYGSDKVAQICTFGRMLARGAVRDVGRVLGQPYSFPDKISKLIPLGSQGFPMTITKALEVSPELKSLANENPDARKILDIAREIEGNARHASVHAAGVVVSPTKMTDFTPLQLEPSGSKIISQYEMHACEDVGLVKFDILGIRNLSILNAAVEIIERETEQKVDLSKLPLDDKNTFSMLTRGETMGVFQLGGSGMTKWLKELRPNRVEDIMVMIALFRPGPMANIPEYIARKNSKSKIIYLHPKMANFLEKSYGILVYQEDILFTAMELAGYNWETVDKLRTAIGKKIPTEMAKQHDILVKGCIDNSGMTKDEAEKIWDLFVPFQGYGFNKAHAASYGLVSYQTAYLKCHYPVEYMTALLTAESNDTDKVVEGVEECRRMGIVVLPPNINSSHVGFAIEENKKSLTGKAIRFGLNAVKNVGDVSLEEIVKAREKGGNFKSFCDFYLRVNGQKVNKKVLESLIKTGALDFLGKRASLLAGLDLNRNKCEQILRQRSGGQSSLFANGKDSDITNIPEDNFPDIDEFSKNDLMNLEKDLLGFYLTENPLSSKLSLLAIETDFRLGHLESETIVPNKRIKVGGLITSLRIVNTKRNNSEMAFATLEDGTGKAELVIFPKVFTQYKNIWEKDKVVIVEGKLDKRDEGVLTVLVDSGRAVSDDDAKDFDFVLNFPKGISSSNLVEINRILKDNPGDMKGLLIFENGSGPKKLALNFGVNYTKEIEVMINQLLQIN